MGLNTTQKRIERVLRAQCDHGEPFTTIGRIAEDVEVSRETVRQKIDDIVAERVDIEKTKIGQAQVYYISPDIMSQFMTDRSVVAGRLTTLNEARFYELREAGEESPFDLEAHWYDGYGEELADYRPNEHEMGEAQSSVAVDALSVKMYESDEEKTMEDVMELLPDDYHVTAPEAPHNPGDSE